MKHSRVAFAAYEIATRFEGGSGTGLLTDQGRWLDALVVAVAEFDPDMVVIEACCNYGASPEHPEYLYYHDDGSPVVPDSEEMYALWAEAAEQALDLAAAAGAEVWWVITPPTAPEIDVHERIERFNRITRELASRNPELHLLDWAEAVTTDSGALLDPVVLPDGTTTPLRVDGLHFSDAGNALLTESTVDALLDPSRSDQRRLPR